MKKAIDWFVLVVGLALAGSGGYWMWTGWDIVQVERGWASLISGAVMLSGGFVVFALAWLAMRVSGLSTRAPATVLIPDISAAEEFAPPPKSSFGAAGAYGAAAAATVAATAVAVEAVAGHDKPAEQPQAQDEPEKGEPEKEVGHDVRAPSLPSASELLKLSEIRGAEPDFWRSEESPEPQAAAEPQNEPLAPAHDWSTDPPPFPLRSPAAPEVRPVAVEAEPELKLEPAAEREPRPSPVPPPLAFEPPPVPAPPPAAAPETIVPPPAVEHEAAAHDTAAHEPPAHEAPVPDSPVHEAQTHEAPVHEAQTHEAPAHESPAHESPADDDWLEETKRSLDRELGRTAIRDEPIDDDDRTRFQPPPAEPTVVGRYSSGDTNYVMFADGSIEAQTPEGVMRFASLIELRRFVEQRH